MSISRFNHEGYYDPTTYEALTAVEREQRKERFRPIVYVCSPYSGDISGNKQNARKYCRFAVDQHCIPLAPHLLFPQFMNDGDPEERDLAMFMDIAVLSKCAEVWVFGKNITEGMTAEINYALSRDKPIRYFDTECKEVAACSGI
ncbi:MAG: DUF4406 domain-containing protein [Clostridiales bacterium]|nr:DUF4406 domain-containing protein [Clostridiales bacterium]